MTPQHLHAIASLWSLAAAWPHLLQAAYRAAEASGDDRGTVQAWRPGSGVHTGRTGDQILDAILRETGEAANPYRERKGRTASTMLWLVTNTGGSGAGTTSGHIEALRTAAPNMIPSTAMDVAQWAESEDRAIRQLLHEPHDHAALNAINCPRCDTGGSLAIRTSNPDTNQRPIICTQPRCLMAGAIPSIWTQHQLSTALDALAKT